MLAYLLRFDFAPPENEARVILVQLPFVLALQLTALSYTGVYAFIWRYVGMSEIKAFAKAAVISTLPILMLRLWLPETLQALRVPLSIIVMDTILAFGGVSGCEAATIWTNALQTQRVRSNNSNVMPMPSRC